MAIEVGSILEGKITGITHFGAFVELSEGVTGLVHISEVADAYVRDIRDYLKENDVVKVKVINVANGKIGLSIKQVNAPAPSGNGRSYGGPGRGRGGGAPFTGRRTFEDKLKHFMKESEERQSTLKRSLDSKRGGRGTRRDF